MKKRKLMAAFLGACMILQMSAVGVMADGEAPEETAAYAARAAQESNGFQYEVLGDGTVCIVGYTGTASDIVIPAAVDGRQVTQIGTEAFAEYNLSVPPTSIVVPEGVTTISEYAFAFNEELTSITLPDSVTALGRSALKGGAYETIRLPKNLTYLADDMFLGCENLKEIIWPETLTEMGEAVFRGCSSLESVAIPDGVELINVAAFLDCTSLKTVVLPDSVDDIGAFAFENCASLTSINIPYGTTDIGNDAFRGCSSLKTLKLPSTINTIWSETAFAECSSDFALQVAAGTYTEEYAKENGYAYTTYIENPYPDVTPEAWYYDYVCWAYENNLMSGYENGNFGPADLLTRGQFSIILYRYEGTPQSTGTSPFPDVADGLYYTDAIVWAKGTGVVGGYDNGYFGPDDFMNREQLATMMYRYAQYKGYDTAARADLSAFPDAGNVNAFAQEAMQWAVAEGLISGDNGMLNPQGNANRAVTATIVNRFVNAYK